MEQTTPAAMLFERLRSAALGKDWKAARKLIRDLRDLPVETEWVDWKLANRLENGRSLGRDDKKNLAKCLSAFANTSGGLIAWGISDDRKLIPFEEYQKHLTHQLRLIASATMPPIVGVDAIGVPAKEGDGGFVVTYVPRSDGAPHQVSLDVEGKGLYFGRFGSECKHLDHYRVSDLLGRRPGAKFRLIECLKATWKWHSTGTWRDQGYHVIVLELGVSLANLGAQTAHNVFGTVEWPHNIKEVRTFEGVRFELNWTLSCKAMVLRPDQGEQQSALNNGFTLSLPKPLFAGHVVERWASMCLSVKTGALHPDRRCKEWLVRVLTQFIGDKTGTYMVGADNGTAVNGSSKWTPEDLAREFPDECG